MARKYGDYERLPGVGRSSIAFMVSTWHHLWLGRDHLLSVVGKGFSEECKRFSFADIQAVVVRKTGVGRTINILTGFVAGAAGLFVVLASVLAWPAEIMGVPIFFAAAFGIALLVNVAKGPTCTVHLQTAVQIERLRSLNRLRTARRVLARLRETVESAQGRLTREEILESYHVPVEPDPSRFRPVPVLTPVGARSLARNRPVHHYGGRAHAILFSFLLADVIHSAAQFLWSSMLMPVLAIVVLVGLLVSLVMSLIRQNNSDIPGEIRSVVWGTLAYVILANLLGGIYSAMYMISHPEVAGNSYLFMHATSQVDPYDSVFLLIILLVSIGFAGVLGLLGFVRLARFRNRTEPSSPPHLSGDDS